MAIFVAQLRALQKEGNFKQGRIKEENFKKLGDEIRKKQEKFKRMQTLNREKNPIKLVEIHDKD